MDTLPLQQIRQKLFGISYQMLGSAAEAEDVAQEVIASFITQKSTAYIHNKEAFLVRSAVNRCLNLLKGEKRRQYVGEYLPEPILDEEIRVQNRLDISYGFALLLRRLNPQERAIFLMRNSFDLPFSELAEHFELQQAHVRKLFQRANAKMQQARSNRQGLEIGDQIELIERFLEAASSGRIEQLTQLLKDDMALWSDGGGKKTAARKPIYGRENCLKFIFGLAAQAAQQGEVFDFRIQVAEDEAFLLYYIKQELESVIYFGFAEQQVDAIYIQRNPDKFNFVVTN